MTVMTHAELREALSRPGAVVVFERLPLGQVMPEGWRRSECNLSHHNAHGVRLVRLDAGQQEGQG